MANYKVPNGTPLQDTLRTHAPLYEESFLLCLCLMPFTPRESRRAEGLRSYRNSRSAAAAPSAGGAAAPSAAGAAAAGAVGDGADDLLL